MQIFANLREQLLSYLPESSVEQVHQSYLFASEAHGDQKRASGEPYITHPVAVANILANMHMDKETIMAAIMHDVLEDTGISKEEMGEKFGQAVVELVDGVSKLTQIKFGSKAEAQAENFRKMVLAMVRDIRVILVKLADRLHNMRTIAPLPPHKRRRIAIETLEIYAPIANRLGMHCFKVEFEDLCFSAIYPLRTRVLRMAVANANHKRDALAASITQSIADSITQNNIEHFHISRHIRHLSSIYKKMRNERLSYMEVMDTFTFRILVDDMSVCYRVLGAVHNVYKPVPEHFKDYIAIPKANGYQSLHTMLFGPHGVPIEIQIRTREMDRVAEHGITSHWLFQTSGQDTRARAQEWLQGLFEMQQSTGSSIEFVENVKSDLFPDEVYVFTPSGDIMELPLGATAVDFAYAVHSDVGNSCIAAKINRHLSPLSTPLVNGQTVEVITAPGAAPNPAWLNFVITGKARSNIRHFLKSQRRAESAALGCKLLEKSLARFNLELDKVSEDIYQHVLSDLNFDDVDELLTEIGLGNMLPQVIALRLAAGINGGEESIPTEAPQPLMIQGCEGMMIEFAKCCQPIPGDPIVGTLAQGQGLVIHNSQCHKLAEKRHHTSDDYIEVQWQDDVCGDFSIDIRIEVDSRRGVLAVVASAISDTGANIENITVEDREGLYSWLHFSLGVRNRVHLARVMRRLRSLKEVNRIIRSK